MKEASRLFRERGFENVSVGEVMKAAGLTHGAFYAHLGSEEELQAAAMPTAKRFRKSVCGAATATRAKIRMRTGT